MNFLYGFLIFPLYTKAESKDKGETANSGQPGPGAEGMHLRPFGPERCRKVHNIKDAHWSDSADPRRGKNVWPALAAAASAASRGPDRIFGFVRKLNRQREPKYPHNFAGPAERGGFPGAGGGTVVARSHGLLGAAGPFRLCCPATQSLSQQKGKSGLDLHIVKKLIERQGGTIKADNAPEGGARLELVLPELEGNAG